MEEGVLPQEGDDNDSDTLQCDVSMDEGSQVQVLKERVSELEEKAIRAYAECDNIRKRADKERRDILRFANKGLLTNLLGFMDDFERALKAAEGNEVLTDNDFYKGIQLIHKRFLSFLEEHGVQEMEALNCEFDPNIHEALSVIEKPDLESETVVDVYAKGYTLQGEMLRAAKVIIGKPQA